MHGFSIGSWHFALISLLGFFGLRFSTGERLRTWTLLLFNLYFTSFLLTNSDSVLTMAIYLISVYRLARGPLDFSFDGSRSCAPEKLSPDEFVSTLHRLLNGLIKKFTGLLFHAAGEVPLRAFPHAPRLVTVFRYANF